MTTITLDPQPDNPECFRIDATTAPRNAPPSDDRPRLVCEWKRTADGQLTGTWTLRDANLASVPELSPEEVTLQPDVCTFKDRTTMPVRTAFSCGFCGHRARFEPSWEWLPPSSFLV